MQSLAAALISRILPGRSEDIDDRLAAQFGRRALASFHEYFADRQNVTTIESQHDEDLNNIVHVKRPRWATRRIKGAPSMAWPTGPGEEIYLPIDGFWVCATPSAEGRDRVIVRLRYEQELRRTEAGAAQAVPPRSGSIDRSRSRWSRRASRFGTSC